MIRCIIPLRTVGLNASKIEQACLAGSTECVSVLLSARPSIDTQDRRGYTALMRALSCENHAASTVIASMLLDMRCQVAARNLSGDTALTLVCSRTNVGAEDTTVQRILELSAAATLTSDSKSSSAASKHPLEATNSRGRSALACACASGNLTAVKQILDFMQRLVLRTIAICLI